MANSFPTVGLAAFFFGYCAVSLILDLLGRNALWLLAFRRLDDAQKAAFDPQRVRILQIVISALLTAAFVLALPPVSPLAGDPALLSLALLVLLILCCLLMSNGALRRFCLRGSRKGDDES
ncbi:MAG: hypothetical protein ACLUUL_04615 [Gemmiger sp.]